MVSGGTTEFVSSEMILSVLIKLTDSKSLGILDCVLKCIPKQTSLPDVHI